MATLDKHYGAWRAGVRRNGITCTKTLPKKSDAARWAAEAERAITLGLPLWGDNATLSSILKHYAREITPRKNLLRRNQIAFESCVDQVWWRYRFPTFDRPT